MGSAYTKTNVDYMYSLNIRRMVIAGVAVALIAVANHFFPFLEWARYLHIACTSDPIERVVLINAYDTGNAEFWTERYKQLLEDAKSKSESELLKKLIDDHERLMKSDNP